MRNYPQFIVRVFWSGLIAIAFNLYFFSHFLVAQTSDPILTIQQGIELYQAERYQAALKIWQDALIKTQDLSTQAFIKSNIASAWRELGYLAKAETSIRQSLEILSNLDSPAAVDIEIKAKVLNINASIEWSKGNFPQAISLWDSAAANYLQIEDSENALKCQLNRAKALQALGLTDKARIELERIQATITAINNPQLQAIGLQYLGNVLRQVGNLEKSATVLQASLNIANSATTLLELANTERALSDNYLATDRLELADKYAELAIANYREAFASRNNLKAGINLLGWFVALGKWSEIDPLITRIEPYFTSFSGKKSIIKTRLNFLHNLSCLKEITERNNFACGSQIRQASLQQSLESRQPNITTPSWEQITREINAIIPHATDTKTKSYAIGELGRIYESQQKWQLANQYTQQALSILEGIDAPEISYRWQWQLGRIYRQQGKIPEAITAYSAAIEHLKSVRNDLLIVNTELQFSFRDNIEPIYRELVDLLLHSDRNSAISPQNLERAIQNIDTLQLTEVENFLNCELNSISQIKLTSTNLDRVSDRAGFIYPIVLPDRLEVIYKLPGQPLKHQTNIVDRGTVEQTIRKLKTAILRGYPERVISFSSTIYNWLIRPLATELVDSSEEIDTLVFVLDGELRNIPMGVLYDSQQQEYLIQKPYALALLPSFQVFDLESQPSELKVLGAGISEQLQIEDKSFIDLNVTEELKKIQNTVANSSILLDSQFTTTNIQQNLEQENFSVIHLATHGNFSSDPEETYLVVYDSATSKASLLKAKEFNKLLARTRTQPQIDLLVLSACETAEGDNRAVLGLAGLAVKAGTKSTLATLWQVSDESTVKLMSRFYRELSVPQTSKAMALHRAQQALFDDINYQTPFYWSPYVLVGNWQ